MAKLPIKGKGPSPIRSVGKEIGEAIGKMIDDFGSIFTQKPGGKVKKITKPQDAIKEIQGGAKIVPQGPVTGGRTQGQRIPDAIQAMPGTAGGVARTISRGRTPIGELVKSGQRAKPRGMGDRKPIATRPKPPAKRGNTMPVPKPKPKPPAVARPKPKPPVRAGGSGGGNRPPGNRTAPGSRPGQRPPRIVGTTRSARLGATGRAALPMLINPPPKPKGPPPAPADPLKSKKRATPGGMADRKPSRPNQRGGSGPSTRGGRRGSGRKMSDKISNIFGVDGVSKTGSTRNDYLIGWTDGKGGKGPNYDRLKNIKKKSEITSIVDTARKRATVKKRTGGSFSSKKIPIVTVGPKGGKNKGKVVGTANKIVKKKAGGKMSSETRARSRIYKAPKSPMTNAKPKIKKYRPTTKFPKATPKIKKYRPKIDIKPFSKGGKVARQVKGFGAARRPKK